MNRKEHPEFESRLKWFMLGLLFLAVTGLLPMLKFRGEDWSWHFFLTTPGILAAVWVGWMGSQLDATKSGEK